jgi:hypothetical protein
MAVWMPSAASTEATLKKAGVAQRSWPIPRTVTKKRDRLGMLTVPEGSALG